MREHAMFECVCLVCCKPEDDLAYECPGRATKETAMMIHVTVDKINFYWHSDRPKVVTMYDDCQRSFSEEKKEGLSPLGALRYIIDASENRRLTVSQLEGVSK